MIRKKTVMTEADNVANDDDEHATVMHGEDEIRATTLYNSVVVVMHL